MSDTMARNDRHRIEREIMDRYNEILHPQTLAEMIKTAEEKGSDALKIYRTKSGTVVQYGNDEKMG